MEIRDCDAEYKGKHKIYSDSSRNATESDIQAGDVVLIRNESQGKTQSTFLPDPGTVVERRGANVKVKTADGKLFDRNVSVVKRYYTCESVVGADQEEDGSRDIRDMNTDSPNRDIRDINTDSPNTQDQPAFDTTITNRQSSHTHSPQVDNTTPPPNQNASTTRSKSTRATNKPIWLNDYMQ